MDDPNATLLAAARSGDGRAFDALVAPHRRALLGHCYRMLASAADADDAVQEALVRAWKYLPGFEARSSLRTWLFGIATRTCLDLLERRGPRRLPAFDDTPPADPAQPPGPPVTDPVWLEPMPDARWCEGDPDEPEGPEAACTRRESVAVAFLAAIQMLPASQRAALLLHDVAGWKAHEVAEALGTSAAAVNSALQRARATLDQRAPSWNQRARRVNAADSDVLSRYVRAWNSGDAKVLAAVLREDVSLSMPPIPAWYRGRDAVVRFFTGFLGSLPFRFALFPAPSTNGRPALASYRTDPTAPGVLRADGLHVLEIDPATGAVTGITAFLGESAVTAHGLPAERPAEGLAG